LISSIALMAASSMGRLAGSGGVWGWDGWGRGVGLRAEASFAGGQRSAHTAMGLAAAAKPRESLPAC
jgi:hypothetical protein